MSMKRQPEDHQAPLWIMLVPVRNRTYLPVDVSATNLVVIFQRSPGVASRERRW